MNNEEAFEKIKKAVINIDGKDYIKIKRNTLKKLGYHCNIFTKMWKRTKFKGMVSSLKFKATKQDKDNYLIRIIDLDALSKPLASWFVVPYIIEMIEAGE